MKLLHVIVVTATLVVVLALNVFSATVPCPKCELKEDDLIICAVELGEDSSKYKANFRSFCEMSRFNCLNHRSYYTISVGHRCENIEKAWAKTNYTDKPRIYKKEPKV